MRNGLRALPLVAVAALMLVVAACGGDDSKAETKSGNSEATAAAATAASGAGGIAGASSSSSSSSSAQSSGTPAGQATSARLNVDCGDNLKAFKFQGKLAVKMPQSSPAGGSNDFGGLLDDLLGDVTFSGAYVAPDRTQMKLEFGGQNSLFPGGVEFVQIGAATYTKLGNTGWQQGTGGTGADEFLSGLDPRDLCANTLDDLPAPASSAKVKVNGVDAVRYDYDRKSIQNLNGFLGADDLDELPENFKLSVWVAEKERFPVKLTASASGGQGSDQISFNVEFNVTDLNSSNVKIDAPR